MDAIFEKLAKIGARRIVASEKPHQPGVPKKGMPLVAAVTLSQADIGNLDTTVSRIEIVELFGRLWNPRPLSTAIKARIEKRGPRRVFEVIVTAQGDVVVAPHRAAQQALAGAQKSEKKAIRARENAVKGGRPSKPASP